MASQEIQKAIQSYENYISKNGIDEQVIDAYCQASQTAIVGEKDIDYGLKVSARAKELIEEGSGNANLSCRCYHKSLNGYLF